MKFITIEQRAPEGREFSDARHQSSLIVYPTGLQVLGIIPHGSLIRPTTETQRDTWISHLQGLEFEKTGETS